jgi:hypothetical protein
MDEEAYKLSESGNARSVTSDRRRLGRSDRPDSAAVAAVATAVQFRKGNLLHHLSKAAVCRAAERVRKRRLVSVCMCVEFFIRQREWLPASCVVSRHQVRRMLSQRRTATAAAVDSIVVVFGPKLCSKRSIVCVPLIVCSNSVSATQNVAKTKSCPSSSESSQPTFVVVLADWRGSSSRKGLRDSSRDLYICVRSRLEASQRSSTRSPTGTGSQLPANRRRRRASDTAIALSFYHHQHGGGGCQNRRSSFIIRHRCDGRALAPLCVCIRFCSFVAFARARGERVQLHNDAIMTIGRSTMASVDDFGGADFHDEPAFNCCAK